MLERWCRSSPGPRCHSVFGQCRRYGRCEPRGNCPAWDSSPRSRGRGWRPGRGRGRTSPQGKAIQRFSSSDTCIELRRHDRGAISMPPPVRCNRLSYGCHRTAFLPQFHHVAPINALRLPLDLADECWRSIPPLAVVRDYGDGPAVVAREHVNPAVHAQRTTCPIVPRPKIARPGRHHICGMTPAISRARGPSAGLSSWPESAGARALRTPHTR